MSLDFDKPVNSREVIVKTVDGEAIRGKINMGLEERVSDLFTKVETQFIILFEVSHKGGHDKTLFINKRNIIYVEPVS
jgi:small nuclear ribonucleoprotein (snRNP)-like protein